MTDLTQQERLTALKAETFLYRLLGEGMGMPFGWLHVRVKGGAAHKCKHSKGHGNGRDAKAYGP